MPRRKQVTIIGSSDDMSQSETAYNIGYYITKKSCILISGGRGGIMEAACKGAIDAGGTTVGILPGDTADEANAYCNVVIPTGLGFARNSMNVLAGDLIISVHGKAGTLSELAFAWQYNKPIICCAFTGGWSSRFVEEKVDDRPNRILYSAHDMDEVYQFIDLILEESDSI